MWSCFGFGTIEYGSAGIAYWREVGDVKPPGNAIGSMPPVPRVSGLMRLVIVNDSGLRPSDTSSKQPHSRPSPSCEPNWPLVEVAGFIETTPPPLNGIYCRFSVNAAWTQYASNMWSSSSVGVISNWVEHRQPAHC
jgi:hypothetical protein